MLNFFQVRVLRFIAAVMMFIEVRYVEVYI
jgi:hypothetical protein